MNIEQLRADFEAWHKREMWDGGYESGHDEFYPDAYRFNERRVYENMHTQIAWRGYQAGRAALQSQPKHDMTLFCDLKTDDEKSAFFLTGRGYETGVIAQVIQNDVAMAYHRCSEYRKELEALQAQDREDAERIDFIEANPGWLRVSRLGHRTKQMWACVSPFTNYEYDLFKTAREAIDHARRVEGEAK